MKEKEVIYSFGVCKKCRIITALKDGICYNCKNANIRNMFRGSPLEGIFGGFDDRENK